MYYLNFLRQVHTLLEPEHYLEIGVRDGGSMSQARCHSVGVDPAFVIDKEINCQLRLVRTTSDEYFTRPDPLEATGGNRFDLAFIDGMHLFEFALRDFINTERYCSPRSVIIFDDILPRSVDEAARERHTMAWTGDVYPLVDVFARYRPDLTVIPVGTTPTGLLLVLGLDPSNTVLSDNYDRIIAECRKPDPQPVPENLIDRSAVVHPDRALKASFWKVLASSQASDSANDVRTRLRPVIDRELGTAFTPSTAAATA
jgi:hypothetical protein